MSRPSVQVAATPRLALRPQEAAQALGVSLDYFDEHIAGGVRWVRRGRLKLVAISELQGWLEREAALTVGERQR